MSDTETGISSANRLRGIHTVAEISDRLLHVQASLSSLPAPFWEPIDLPDIPLFSGPSETDGEIVLLSGPSRNGNHLLHSLLDGHPSLPRLPGEDSLINFIFERLEKDGENGVSALQSSECADYLSSLSMKGDGNKWLNLHRQIRSKQGEGEASTVWSGMYRGKGQDNFTFDYQDTVVEIDYDSFNAELQVALEITNRSEESNRLHDQLVRYAQALAHLDPEFASRQRSLRYRALMFGSGTRGQLDWLMKRSPKVKAIVPLRPFESYYFSFTKGFFNTLEVREDLLKEAWEHWWHKAVDYLHLKMRYPQQICLVRFESLINETREAATEICEFLEIPFDEACMTPTVLGHPTKGNSSEGRKESSRGTVYKLASSNGLDPDSIPAEYDEFWKSLQSLAV